MKKSEENKSKKIYHICQYWQPDINYEKCYLADITACGGNPERCDLPDSIREAYHRQIFGELIINPERLFSAIQFAAKAHEGQMRKGKNPVPYIAHPLFAGMELLRLGYDENTVIAGILHDTLEDTHFGRDDIKRALGNEVLSLIDAVTEPKNPNMTKEEKRRTWDSRKEAYLEQLKSAPVEARAVACVDICGQICWS